MPCCVLFLGVLPRELLDLSEAAERCDGACNLSETTGTPENFPTQISRFELVGKGGFGDKFDAGDSVPTPVPVWQNAAAMMRRSQVERVTQNRQSRNDNEEGEQRGPTLLRVQRRAVRPRSSHSAIAAGLVVVVGPVKVCSGPSADAASTRPHRRRVESA